MNQRIQWAEFFSAILKKLVKSALPCFCLLGSACNGMFYFPAREALYDPSEIGQSYRKYAVKSSNGAELAAWEFAPEHGDRGCVVHFHGNAENMTTHFLFSSWLAGRGYRVLTFDYQGYGESGGSPSREGSVADGVAMLRDARAKCAQKPIIIFAQSLGGAIAIPAIVQSRVVVDFLLVESSFSSYRRIARQKLGSIWLTWPLQYPLSFLVTDYLAPEEFAPRIQCPTLFVHGNEDQVVPIEFGFELFESIGSSDKIFWEVPRGGHTPAFVRDTSRYRDKLVVYLRDKLRGAAKSRP